MKDYSKIRWYTAVGMLPFLMCASFATIEATLIQVRQKVTGEDIHNHLLFPDGLPLYHVLKVKELSESSMFDAVKPPFTSYG